MKISRHGFTFAAAAIAFCVPVAIRSQVTATTGQPAIPAEGSRVELRPANILIWSDLNVPGFAPGTMMAVVHGDPGAHRDYIIRLRFPAGYRFPVHWQPNSEHLTVLSGTLLLAMGNTADESKLRAYGPGDFIYAPARMSHYGGARTPTVIQLNGNGPFAINLGVAPPSR
ncbi:MAG TPA: cupin domain-containing protein [Gemmatimonadaceae bacterium]